MLASEPRGLDSLAALGNIDLLGDPIPPGWGRPGRPLHMATAKNLALIRERRALGQTQQQIAEALGITVPTLRRAYAEEVCRRGAGLECNSEAPRLTNPVRQPQD